MLWRVHFWFRHSLQLHVMVERLSEILFHAKQWKRSICHFPAFLRGTIQMWPCKTLISSPACRGPLWPGRVNRWMHPCLPSVSVCLPTMVRQEAGQTAVSPSQGWIVFFSARCEEDAVTSPLWDSLVTKARKEEETGCEIYFCLCLYTHTPSSIQHETLPLDWGVVEVLQWRDLWCMMRPWKQHYVTFTWKRQLHTHSDGTVL